MLEEREQITLYGFSIRNNLEIVAYLIVIGTNNELSNLVQLNEVFVLPFFITIMFYLQFFTCFEFESNFFIQNS